MDENLKMKTNELENPGYINYFMAKNGRESKIQLLTILVEYVKMS